MPSWPRARAAAPLVDVEADTHATVVHRDLGPAVIVVPVRVQYPWRAGPGLHARRLGHLPPAAGPAMHDPLSPKGRWSRDCDGIPVVVDAVGPALQSGKHGVPGPAAAPQHRVPPDAHPRVTTSQISRLPAPPSSHGDVPVGSAATAPARWTWDVECRRSKTDYESISSIPSSTPDTRGS